MGLKTTADGVDGLLPHVLEDGIQIAFDATSAYVHAENSRKLNELGVHDDRPDAGGHRPAVRAAGEPAGACRQGGDERQHDLLRRAGDDPHRHAVSRVQAVDYAEIVASLASKSVGPGTRANLDEFTYTTSNAIADRRRRAASGKALAIINPAEPPMIMRNTISCLTDDEPDQASITESVLEMIKEVQKYVPGYRLVNGPLFDGKRVTVFMEVAGLGDYLPTYAGNLDIMTAAATRTAEMFAEEILAGTITAQARRSR